MARLARVPVTFRRSEVLAIDPLVLYEILRLRVDVFIVEQACPYPTSTDATSNLVPSCTGPHGRTGRGRNGAIAARCRRRPAIGGGCNEPGSALTRHRVEVAVRGARPLRRAGPVSASALDARAHPAPWYARFGFEVVGDEFDKNGIRHLPMRRNP